MQLALFLVVSCCVLFARVSAQLNLGKEFEVKSREKLTHSREKREAQTGNSTLLTYQCNSTTAYWPAGRVSYCPDYVMNKTYAIGTDIAKVTSCPRALCCDVCAKHPGCRSVVWDDTDGGTCWLKPTVGGHLIDKGGSHFLKLGGILIQPYNNYKCNSSTTQWTQSRESWCPNYQANVNYASNTDIARVIGCTKSACCDVCAKHPGCKSVVWLAHDRGTCWLKFSAPLDGDVSDLYTEIGTYFLKFKGVRTVSKGKAASPWIPPSNKKACNCSIGDTKKGKTRRKRQEKSVDKVGVGFGVIGIVIWIIDLIRGIFDDIERDKRFNELINKLDAIDTKLDKLGLIFEYNEDEKNILNCFDKVKEYLQSVQVSREFSKHEFKRCYETKYGSAGEDLYKGVYSSDRLFATNIFIQIPNKKNICYRFHDGIKILFAKAAVVEFTYNKRIAHGRNENIWNKTATIWKKRIKHFIDGKEELCTECETCKAQNLKVSSLLVNMVFMVFMVGQIV